MGFIFRKFGCRIDFNYILLSFLERVKRMRVVRILFCRFYLFRRKNDNIYILGLKL